MTNRLPLKENIKHVYPFGSSTCGRIMAGIGLLLLGVSTVWADTPPATDQIDIGIFTAVEGKVAVTHPGLGSAIPAKIQDGVLFKDVIETGEESRSKALLNDDSILTVGEHSRVEITEHIYDPNEGVRSVVINLIKGKVRALVGKAFRGSGSKFEIHTPSAVAAARGTYFIVFHVNGVSGITNVGTHGHVDFTSGGRTVPVPPGHFSVTPPGGGAPAPPTVNTGGKVPPQVATAVQGTEVKDSPKEESPKQMAMASGGTAPVMSPSSLTSPTASQPGGGATSSSSSGDSSGSGDSSTSGGTSGSGGTAPSGSTAPTTTTSTTTTTAVQVPAVTSGASPSAPPPEPPPPPAPPPPPVVDPTPPVIIDPTPPSSSPHSDIADWFKKILARLFENFSDFLERTDKQEERALTKAESDYEKRLRIADAEEQKKIQEALEKEAKKTAQGTEEYNKTIAKLTEESSATIAQLKKNLQEAQESSAGMIKGLQTAIAQQEPGSPALPVLQKQLNEAIAVRDAAIAKAQADLTATANAHEQSLAKAQERLAADIKKAETIREAKENRAKQVEEAKIAKAGKIREARIVRAQALEGVKVDRSGGKLAQRVSRAGDRYLAKLQAAKASQAELDEARRQINEKIAEAEERVKLAQQAAVEDEIVLKTAGLVQEREFIRKFGRLSAEQRSYIQQQRKLNRQARMGQRQAFKEQRQAFKQQRELIKEQRKALKQERREARESKRNR